MRAAAPAAKAKGAGRRGPLVLALAAAAVVYWLYKRGQANAGTVAPASSTLPASVDPGASTDTGATGPDLSSLLGQLTTQPGSSPPGPWVYEGPGGSVVVSVPPGWSDPQVIEAPPAASSSPAQTAQTAAAAAAPAQVGPNLAAALVAGTATGGPTSSVSALPHPGPSRAPVARPAQPRPAVPQPPPPSRAQYSAVEASTGAGSTAILHAKLVGGHYQGGL